MSAETKWTPGPWKAERISKQEVEIGAETPRGHLSVAWVHLGAEPTPADVADGLADAAMLAAAPDLYETLGDCLSLLEGMESSARENEEGMISAQIAEARAALAKTRGEEETP